MSVRGCMNKFEKHFNSWYWSYGYGSKLACIKMVEQSDLPEDEKKRLIAYHTSNLGKFSI